MKLPALDPSPAVGKYQVDFNYDLFYHEVQYLTAAVLCEFQLSIFKSVHRALSCCEEKKAKIH